MSKDSKVSMRVRIGENELEVSGPRDFVEKKIKEFLKDQKEYTKVSRPLSKDRQKSQTEPVPKKRLSTSQIFRKISPRTDVNRTLVAGYYLEKFEDHESFTAAEIRETIRKARINPPNNTNECINANIRKGLIMSAGDKEGINAFVLTSDGEDIINELLV